MSFLVQQLHEVLMKTSVSIVGTDPVIAQKASSPITECFNKLSSHHIHSVPVEKENKFTNFIDLLDIVHHLFSSFTPKELATVNIPKVMQWNGEYIRVLEEKQKLWEIEPSSLPDESKIIQFRSKTTGEVANQPFVSVPESSTLQDLIDLMANERMKRVVVADSQGSAKRIVTQMDVIKWLDSNIGTLSKESTSARISQLNLDQNKNVAFINQEATAFEAFKLIHQKNITGVPIVDKNNTISGTISISDLKVIMFNGNEYLNLFLPASEYLKKIKESPTCQAPNRAITCTSQTSFSSLISQIAKNGIHRVYIVDHAQHLEGVITLTDIMSCLSTKKPAL